MKKKNIWFILGWIIAIIIYILLLPFTGFWCGYFFGWLAKITIGKYLMFSINMIFNSNFSADALPYIGGFLGFISIFFNKNNSKANNMKSKSV